MAEPTVGREEGGGRIMSKQLGTVFYVIGIVLAAPFVLLIGASIMRMFTDGFEAKYVSSAFLGLFCAMFSYAVGYLLRHMVFEYVDRN
jgi:hypothetical protein